MLGQVLPDVYTRFGEAAAKSAEVKRGLDALLTATDLQGLPSCVYGARDSCATRELRRYSIRPRLPCVKCFRDRTRGCRRNEGNRQGAR